MSAAQSAHPAPTSICLVNALPCPTGHFEGEHVAESAAAHVPAAQSAHPPASAVALVVALPCPAGHFETEHVVALAADHLPAPHSVHVAASNIEDVPAAQSAHPPASAVALVVALPCPAGHFEALQIHESSAY